VWIWNVHRVSTDIPVLVKLCYGKRQLKHIGIKDFPCHAILILHEEVSQAS